MFYSLQNLVEQFPTRAPLFNVFEFLHNQNKERERKSMKSHQKMCKNWNTVNSCGCNKLVWQ